MMGMCVCVNSYATRSDSALQQRKIKTKLQTGVAYDVNSIIPRFNCNREAVENLTFTDVPRRHVTLLSEATFERNAFHSSVFFGALLWLPPILPFQLFIFGVFVACSLVRRVFPRIVSVVKAGQHDSKHGTCDRNQGKLAKQPVNAADLPLKNTEHISVWFQSNQKPQGNSEETILPQSFTFTVTECNKKPSNTKSTR